ncbi:hypothetical protein ACQWU4_07065, partial [Chryseobacterium sp. MIQD13]|uniref:hypothetical protein n=1 Tax=Chryseobacterium sp. MIQD13 TaxID=3422310 RepID=UPI003D297DD9
QDNIGSFFDLLNEASNQSSESGGGGLITNSSNGKGSSTESFSNNGDMTFQVPEVVVTAKKGANISSEDVMNAMTVAFKKVLDDFDRKQTTSNTTWWINTAVGAAATANVPRSGFFKYNELWHQTKTRGISYAWESKWKNPGAKFWRGQQVKGFQGAKSLGTKLTAAGGALLVADIAMSGELKPSHAINAAMLVASTTGVGSIVAGVWFVADMGTMGVNYMINGEAKGLGDMIDESVANEYGKFEMYDGLY